MAKYPTYGREEFPYGDEEAFKQVFFEAYENGREMVGCGKVADYIPELRKADYRSFGICLLKKDGSFLSHGDVETRFSMQSICKTVMLAVALRSFGFAKTFSHVKMEPSGDSFNSIIKLDTASNLPYNPMINAGAIQIASLLSTRFSFEELLGITKSFCMDDGITLNRAVYESEWETGDRNRAIAYLLKSKGVLQADPQQTLDLYIRMCSLNVTAKSLAGLGLILANDGRNPFTGEQLVHPRHIRTVNSIMFTCGMYDGSGEFGVKVGIPAKSGVGGGITCGVKGRMGIGIYGPALDEKGNSIAGITALEHLSHLMHLSVFDYHPMPEGGEKRSE